MSKLDLLDLALKRGLAGMIAGFLFFGGFVLVTEGCTSSQQRELKSFKAEWTGGVDRKVTVYDYNGKIIKTYEGRIDMSKSEREVDLLLDGKRIIIHGGIVIAEEK